MEMTVDGETLAGNRLALRDDGRVHQVEVILGYFAREISNLIISQSQSQIEQLQIYEIADCFW